MNPFQRKRKLCVLMPDLPPIYPRKNCGTILTPLQIMHLLIYASLVEHPTLYIAIMPTLVMLVFGLPICLGFHWSIRDIPWVASNVDASWHQVLNAMSLIHAITWYDVFMPRKIHLQARNWLLPAPRMRLKNNMDSMITTNLS